MFINTFILSRDLQCFVRVLHLPVMQSTRVYHTVERGVKGQFSSISFPILINMVL